MGSFCHMHVFLLYTQMYMVLLHTAPQSIHILVFVPSLYNILHVCFCHFNISYSITPTGSACLHNWCSVITNANFFHKTWQNHECYFAYKSINGHKHFVNRTNEQFDKHECKHFTYSVKHLDAVDNVVHWANSSILCFLWPLHSKSF